MTRCLQTDGWLNKYGEPLQPYHPVLSTSLLVEAKMSDWYKGIGQLLHARWCATKAALLMPARVCHRVKRKTLKQARLGLLSVCDDDQISWVAEAPALSPGVAADAWLGELIIRAFESGTVIEY